MLLITEKRWQSKFCSKISLAGYRELVHSPLKHHVSIFFLPVAGANFKCQAKRMASDRSMYLGLYYPKSSDLRLLFV